MTWSSTGRRPVASSRKEVPTRSPTSRRSVGNQSPISRRPTAKPSCDSSATSAIVMNFGRGEVAERLQCTRMCDRVTEAEKKLQIDGRPFSWKHRCGVCVRGGGGGLAHFEEIVWKGLFLLAGGVRETGHYAKIRCGRGKDIKFDRNVAVSLLIAISGITSLECTWEMFLWLGPMLDFKSSGRWLYPRYS